MMRTSSPIYESPTRATTKSVSKILKEVCLPTPTSGCFRTPTSTNGVTTRTSGCFGSRATRARARLCYCTALSTSYKQRAREKPYPTSSVKPPTSDSTLRQPYYTKTYPSSRILRRNMI
ncbi:hypothetical protein CMUS01_10371 [Colletotrichum musicola]|uniref:Uncharacterized protein n=1 Tax=Colletotrichum musicola TaxID=2175873 RepID=A0A8H6K303_9PEZI|nr:hypothetical protein CMUS01_10371 [Colletotrichum musicola]